MENQPTKLDKVMKISIIVGALIVGLSIAYYLVVYIPKRDESKLARQKDNEYQQQMFDKNVDCSSKYDQKIKDTNNPQGIGAMKLLSGVFYSPQSNSCLYVGLDWDDKIKVKDAITGQELFSEELKDMKEGQVGKEINALVAKYKQ